MKRYAVADVCSNPAPATQKGPQTRAFRLLAGRRLRDFVPNFVPIRASNTTHCRDTAISVTTTLLHLASWTHDAVYAECRDAYNQYSRDFDAHYAAYFAAHPEERGTHLRQATDLERALPPGWEHLADDLPSVSGTSTTSPAARARCWSSQSSNRRMGHEWATRIWPTSQQSA